MLSLFRPLPYIFTSLVFRAHQRDAVCTCVQLAEARAVEAEYQLQATRQALLQKEAEPSPVSPQAASVVRSAASAVRSAVEDVAEMHTVSAAPLCPPWRVETAIITMEFSL